MAVGRCMEYCPSPALALLVGLEREQRVTIPCCCDTHRSLETQRPCEAWDIQIQAVFLVPYGCWPGGHLLSEVMEGPCPELSRTCLKQIWSTLKTPGTGCSLPWGIGVTLGKAAPAGRSQRGTELPAIRRHHSWHLEEEMVQSGRGHRVMSHASTPEGC